MGGSQPGYGKLDAIDHLTSRRFVTFAARREGDTLELLNIE